MDNADRIIRVNCIRNKSTIIDPHRRINPQCIKFLWLERKQFVISNGKAGD